MSRERVVLAGIHILPSRNSKKEIILNRWTTSLICFCYKSKDFPEAWEPVELLRMALTTSVTDTLGLRVLSHTFKPIILLPQAEVQYLAVRFCSVLLYALHRQSVHTYPAVQL